MSLTSEEIATLTMLEEAMWIGTSRYDLAFQERHLSADFFEFGRSGNLYSRSQSLLSESAGHDFQAQLPLDDLRIRRLDTQTVQLTYNSHVQREGIVLHARRSSIWSQQDGTWVMRFHQGTPYDVQAI